MLTGGFHATEAPALQRAIVQALGADRARGTAVQAELEVVRGRGENLALVWRNAIVGFVPADEAVGLAPLLPPAGSREITVVDGSVFPLVLDPAPAGADKHGVLWRLWVGQVPDELPPVPDGFDRLDVPEPKILGIPVSRLRDTPER